METDAEADDPSLKFDFFIGRFKQVFLAVSAGSEPDWSPFQNPDVMWSRHELLRREIFAKPELSQRIGEVFDQFCSLKASGN